MENKLVLCDECGRKLSAVFAEHSITIECCPICLNNKYKEGWESALEASLN